jgi:hypothetical protein
MHISLADLGMWPALPLTGYLILRGTFSQVPAGGRLNLFTRLSLIFAAGMAVWSIPLLGAALVGVFSSKALGLAGWLATLAAIWILRKTLAAWPARLKAVLNELKLQELVFIAGILITGCLYLSYSNESVLGGRDQGVYANHGVFIANHGCLRPDYPLPDEGSKTGSYLAGLYDTRGAITVQFGHLYPVWLAQAYGAFGIRGLLGLNGVLALFSLGLFYGLLRSFVSKPLAMAGALFLGLNASQIWLARITLTEIMAQMWVLAALLTADLALRGEKPGLARWSGIFWGMTALCRIDSFLFLPLIVIAHGATRYLSLAEEGVWKEFWPRLYQGAVPTFAAALAYYYFFSQPYFIDLQKQMLMIGGLLAAAIIGQLALSCFKRSLPRIVGPGQKTFWILALLTTAVFIYGHLLRPYLEPFSLISWPGHVLDGTRSFRENTIVNMGLYLSVPVLYLALTGWLTAAKRLLSSGEKKWLFPLIITGCFSAGYLYDPNISPDHFWSVRRFVPVIIPGFVFWGAIGLARIMEYLHNSRVRKVIILGLAVYLFLFTLQLDRPIAVFAENRGCWQQLTGLAEIIPDDGLVLSSYDELYTMPLFMAFNKRVVPISNTFNPYLEKILSEEMANNQKIYVVGRTGFAGQKTRKIGEVTLNRDFMEAKTVSLPARILHEQKKVAVFVVEREYAGWNGTLLGAYMVPGVSEQGFYGHETDQSGQPFRWTNGRAQLIIPWTGPQPPQRLRVSLLVKETGGELSIRINGHELVGQQLEAGLWEKDIDLAGLELQAPLKVEINSPFWVPAKVTPGSNDVRNLGVAVYSVQLFDQMSD